MRVLHQVVIFGAVLALISATPALAGGKGGGGGGGQNTTGPTHTLSYGQLSNHYSEQVLRAPSSKPSYRPRPATRSFQ
jgi:hypothetical protein